MNDNDQYAQWDAAYVLGALVGAERAEYEEHLAGCAACRAAVAELAGLPGLLGQLSPAEAIAVESDSGAVDGGDDIARYAGPFTDPRALPEPPSSLMPRLPEIGPVPRPWLAPMAAAAAALLIGGVGGYAVSASRDGVPGAGPSSTLAVGSSRLAFVPVSASPMTAVVDVVPTGQGTEVRVECQYAPATATGTATGAATGTATGAATGPSTTGSRAGDGSYPGIRYAIWVVGVDGREMQVKDWTARSGRVMHPSGVTSWPVAQIESVEIRLADTGDTVMRAQVS
ncbi:MAG: zf-HC2 domain-containing protein [Pedococcus sp.]